MSPFGGLRLALGFLTRVPMGTIERPRMVDAVPWFPVVGLLVGAVQGLVLVGAGRLWPPLVAAVLAVGAANLVTGAFHLDGLADVADAFGGGWTVEQRMEILKDSRLGTYGTTALTLALIGEVGLLSNFDSWHGLRATVAAHAVSRAVAVLVMLVAPVAGDGMGASYVADLGPLPVVVAGAVGVGAAVALLGPAIGGIALLAALVAAAAMTLLARNKIGGVTGDVLGAVQVLAALAVLLVASIEVG